MNCRILSLESLFLHARGLKFGQTVSSLKMRPFSLSPVGLQRGNLASIFGGKLCVPANCAKVVGSSPGPDDTVDMSHQGQRSAES